MLVKLAKLFSFIFSAFMEMKANLALLHFVVMCLFIRK